MVEGSTFFFFAMISITWRSSSSIRRGSPKAVWHRNTFGGRHSRTKRPLNGMLWLQAIGGGLPSLKVFPHHGEGPRSPDSPRPIKEPHRMDLLDKIRMLAVRAMQLGLGPGGYPGDTVIDDVLGASAVMIGGKRTLMFGSNNYLGLTFPPKVIAAAQQ